MSLPINIDGDTVEAITIDGTSVSEVTVDGDVVFSAIPDSENLQAQYDFSREDGTMPVADQTGNGFDLDVGDYTGVGETINGKQAGEFDANNFDRVEISDANWTNLIEPYTVYTVHRLDATTRQAIWAGIIDDGGDSRPFEYRDDAGFGWRLENASTDGSFDTDDRNSTYKVSAAKIAEGDQKIVLEGQEYADTLTGVYGLDKFDVGGSSNLNRYIDGAIGEVLVYGTEHNFSGTDVGNDVLDYLSDKWGVTTI